MEAAQQVERTGTSAAQDSARQIFVDARKGLYRLLADDSTD